MALGRPPAAAEIRQAEQYLGEGRMKLAATDIPEYRRVQTVLASYLRALVSSNEFIFVE